MGLPGVSSDSHDSGRKACYSLLYGYGLRLRAPFSYNPKVFVTNILTDGELLRLSDSFHGATESNLPGS